MVVAPFPSDESQRIVALQALEVLDSPSEDEFDALVRAAAAVCNAPISLISLVDQERQWFKANVGLPGVSQTPRDVAFCSYAILADDLFEVPDALADARFADNPLVVGAPDIRFYAGAPVRLRSGARVGTLCVIDRQPRSLSEPQREVLMHLARAVSRALEGRRATHLSQQLACEMQHQASHDALTGVLNRAAFAEHLEDLVQRAAQLAGTMASVGFTSSAGFTASATFTAPACATPSSHATAAPVSALAFNATDMHALLFIDLDRFKLINDTCGHAVGDRLLAQVALLLTHGVRKSDTVGRMGGDEFAIALHRCGAADAQRVAQKLCDQIDALRLVHEGARYGVGASIGLVSLDGRWLSAESALQAADSACRAAKEGGRNRVHLWVDSDCEIQARQGQTQWATRIEQALDEDRFVLFAQRITPLQEPVQGPVKSPDRGLHAEVLVRMVERDGALVAPGAFLPAAERFHLASRIDRWVLEHTIAWMQRVDGTTAIERVCVNLSGQSVGDRAFHRWAIEKLSAAGPAVCRALCLEITETSAVTRFADAAQFIDAVHAVGARVALDDFGAGASSFGYLKTLRADMLKIDGQFVRGLIDDPLDEVAVRCFVDVAKVMKLETVAEYVDDPRVLERLRALGVDYAQGFLLHRPEPIDRLCDGSARSAPPIKPPAGLRLATAGAAPERTERSGAAAGRSA